MKTYLECWAGAASALFAQALAGEPAFEEGLPKPLSATSVAFAATLSGEVEGRLTVMLDGGILEAPLMGEGADQRAGWAEILREVADAAAGELLAATGIKCRVERFEESKGESKVSRAFELRAGERRFPVLVRDEVRPREAAQRADSAHAVRDEAPQPAASTTPSQTSGRNDGSLTGNGGQLSAGIELLLDVELEASLRFGCREMPLAEILDMGPGDVVQLDRHISDPVDLLVGDKIVARGEVVLVNGNFGLRVSEVAAPRMRLETIRCLF